MAHSALVVSAPTDLPDLLARVRPAGAPDAHARRLPPSVLGDLGTLAARLERAEGVPDGPGLSLIAEDAFHPFFHEVVDLVPADDPEEPIALLGEVWPGFLLGSLLMRRSGVRVSAGAAHAAAGVATTSRLHWASWRPHRPTCAAATFRRDHFTTGAFHYNVDARPELLRAHGGEPPLTSCERLDLLRHRCVLRRAEVAGTAWAWAGHLRYCESRAASTGMVL